MKRKYIYIILFITIGAVFLYLLYFIIYTILSDNKLNTTTERVKFDISAILDISKDRITAESETYNQTKLVEYNCVIDSTYCISIVKVGKLETTDYKQIIKMQKQEIPSRQGWFNYDITSAHPIMNIPMNVVPWYNVLLLPLEEVDKVCIFIDGEILSENILNKTTLFYSLTAHRVLISFNSLNKSDLIFAYAKTNQPTLSNLFFSTDDSNNLYIGYLSTIKGSPKTLRELIY